MKVLIGICSNGTVHTDFALSLAGLTAYKIKGVDVALFHASGCNVDRNRYRCAQAARQHKTDALLFLDTDMIFGPDLLEQLLLPIEDVVAGDYAKRVHPHNGLAHTVEGNPMPVKEGLIEASLLPTGAMLIQTYVFDGIKPPYFENHLPGGELEKFVSGDWDFCLSVREAGFRIYCDTDLELGHVGIVTHYLKDEYSGMCSH